MFLFTVQGLVVLVLKVVEGVWLGGKASGGSCFALKLVLLFEGRVKGLAGFVCFCLLHGGNLAGASHRIASHSIVRHGIS